MTRPVERIQQTLNWFSVEVDFAVDSGFGTCRYARWYDHKYGKLMENVHWVKAHFICGVKTNVVTAIEISNEHSGDSPVLPLLVNATAKGFAISEVSADAAYASAANVTTISAHKAAPFMAFKSNTTGKASALFEQMYHYFIFKREEYLQHYHKAFQCREHLQHAQTQVWRLAQEQNGYRSGQ